MSTFTLRMEMDSIDCVSMYPTCEPDLEWSYTDPAGHTHTHQSESFTWVYEGEEFWFDADGDEHNGDGHYECNACAAEVPPPATRMTPATNGQRQTINGMRSYWVDYADGRSVELTEAEYIERLEGLRAAT